MPLPANLPLFLVAAIVLLLTPGPVVLYTVARSLHQGRQAGHISTVATGLGDFCHVLAATAGVSALLASSALAFSIVKYAGAAYLVYLGVRTLLAREAPLPAEAPAPLSPRRIFSQGLVVSVFNPKTALFFLAFLPQFVEPSHGAVAAQVFFLGCLYVLLGMCTNNGYAVLAGSLRHLLRGNACFLRAQRYVAGGSYLALGVTAALTGGADHNA